MALIYAATLSPSKLDAIAGWLPSQAWAPDPSEVSLVGVLRFDDPDGAVGLETHLVRSQEPRDPATLATAVLR